MMPRWKRDFITIYAGQAFSILGSAAVQFAIIWWLTVQTESAITLTLATIIGFLPNMLLGPFAGIWVDRYNRRTVMIAADSLVAASSVLLGVVFLLTPTPPIWFIYLILLLRGVGGTFHTPAMQAAVPMLVPVELLPKAGGWSNLISSLSNMAGPVLGAALMGFLPIASVMLVDILGALFACACLLFVKIPDVPQSMERSDYLGDLKQGLAAIRENKPLVAVFIPMVIFNIIFMPLGSLYPLLVRTHFGGGAWHNGATEFFFAGGMLVASLVIGIWGGMKRRFLMVSLFMLVLGLASAISGMLPPSAFIAFLVCCFAMGVTGPFINVPLMAYVQQTTAPQVMGKVLSLMMTAMTLAMPFGLLVAGPASALVGVETWFFYSGIAVLATGLLCWWMTRRYDQGVSAL